MWDMLKLNVWKYVAAALGIALVITLLVMGTQTVRIKSLERAVEKQAEQIAELQGEKASLKVSLRNSLTALSAQNDQIAELVAKQRVSSEMADKAVSEARSQSEKWKKVYLGILNAPKPSDDDCKAASITIENYRLIRGEEK